MRVNPKNNILSYNAICALDTVAKMDEINLNKRLYTFLDDLYGKVARGKNTVWDNENKEENEQLEENKNRFYEYKTDRVIYYNGKYKVPDMYKVIEVEIPTEEDYNKLNSEDKTIKEAELYKKIAIINAMRANLENKTKYQVQDAYKYKDNYMERFLLYASKYNQLVSENDQIPFTFTLDMDNPVLDAIVPGYTRISLHFGNINNFRNILNNVNKELVGKSQKKEDNFSNIHRDIKDGMKEVLGKVFSRQFPIKDKPYILDEDEIFNNQFKIKNFGIINTGIINRNNCNGASEYEAELKEVVIGTDEKTDIDAFREYINETHPDFTDREIYYLAGKASFGKGRFIVLNNLLEEREKRREEAKKNGRILKVQYKCEKEQEQLEKMEYLFNFLKNTNNPQKTERVEKFTKQFSELNEGYKTDFIDEWIFENDKFSKENFIHLIKLLDRSMQEDILESIQQQLEDRELINVDLRQILIKTSQEEKNDEFVGLVSMYDKLMENARKVSPTARGVANAIEGNAIDKSINKK